MNTELELHGRFNGLTVFVAFTNFLPLTPILPGMDQGKFSHGLWGSECSHPALDIPATQQV